MRIQKLVSGTLLSASLLLTSREAAAQLNLPPPPTLPQLPSAPPAFSRNVDAEVAAMTGRYGLSGDQQAKVRTILTEQAKKSDEAVNAQLLSPLERLTRLKSVKDEEISRVSAVLNAEQKKKYAQDAVPPLPGASVGSG